MSDKPNAGPPLVSGVDTKKPVKRPLHSSEMAFPVRKDHNPSDAKGITVLPIKFIKPKKQNA